MGVTYDEVFISTKREITVCEESIRKLREDLAEMERRYQLGTREFIERFRTGEMSGDTNRDYRDWYAGYRGLKDWEERLKGYREILKDTGDEPRR